MRAAVRSLEIIVTGLASPELLDETAAEDCLAELRSPSSRVRRLATGAVASLG